MSATISRKHRIQRLGSHEDIDVDVRIVSATHVDMEKPSPKANSVRTYTIGSMY
ncbi:hypothetical protein DSL92_04890 [Billgrantia gudaonensis]|uniref:Sigma-54 factor interaction domain-containing protein n=1 Tax=Billgrantia gudaonensis TaxID=376427 RepID=A0A3S0NHF0_9GAMM|nr:hypothetical protein DSL92_04890 [Halomonas gudaonensis]